MEEINPQKACGFLRLPGEIRNLIYALALTSSHTITDASPLPKDSGTHEVSVHHSLPPLSTPLLRSCRLIAQEAPLRLLYASNTFRFTSPTNAHKFAASLPPELSSRIQDVELDMRNTGSREEQYPAWTWYTSWQRGFWVEQFGSLSLDFPGLKVLRLNFNAWPRIPVAGRHLWDILRRLLMNVDGLERIILTGASEGSSPEKEPWSPAHFIGVEDVAFADDLVDKMWQTVQKVQRHADDGIIRWSRSNSKVYLEVSSTMYLRRTIETRFNRPVYLERSGDWPESGYCSFTDYRNQKEASL
ncbi:hypothetical protein M501DRAFT_1003705 [Patellaria atrata CBS 101060]|uniref:Uncharacterized protein n=1 Tax=Patellaria atrata CBS 101060 TaxID=1346257 RepID=A0A9P4SAK6_9PEZI|nr:hypothetical protein M501DRAFT_1003705 [Patellaria atrata CBS 101060]